MQIISNIALISINETLIVQLISFLIFLYIINRIMFRPLREAMANRENHIRSIQQDIVAAEDKLDALTKQIREHESTVRKEAFDQQKKIEEAGNRKADEIFSFSREEIETVKDKAKKDIDAQVLEAKKYIKTESESLAIGIMEKILDRRLNQ